MTRVNRIASRGNRAPRAGRRGLGHPLGYCLTCDVYHAETVLDSSASPDTRPSPDEDGIELNVGEPSEEGFTDVHIGGVLNTFDGLPGRVRPFSQSLSLLEKELFDSLWGETSPRAVSC